MKRNDRARLWKQVRWATGAFGVALAYFGAFGVLMYPVLKASLGVA